MWARLKWARSSRDSKLAKISFKMNEVQEMKDQLHAKLIEITLLERERDEAQARVVKQRTQYRGELMQLEDDDMITNQLDPRHLDGLSSDVGCLSISDGGFEAEPNDESDNGRDCNP